MSAVAAEVLRAIADMIDAGLPAPHKIDLNNFSSDLPSLHLDTEGNGSPVLAWAHALTLPSVDVKGINSSGWPHVYVTGKCPSGAMLQVEEIVQNDLVPGLAEGEVRREVPLDALDALSALCAGTGSVAVTA